MVQALVGFVGQAVLRGVRCPIRVHDGAHQVVVIRRVSRGRCSVHHQRLLVIQAWLQQSGMQKIRAPAFFFFDGQT
jgi:hypothetical protein